MTNLIIYGVFDRRADKCIKVGSTITALRVRAKRYKDYKWYDPAIHEHRVLWEGELREDDFQFIRAAKEVMWIARMRTWRSQGGLNQMNPLLHQLRNPTYFMELAAAGGTRKWSAEERQARSAAYMGRSVSPETCQKIRMALTGKKHTEERKKNARGRPSPYKGMPRTAETKRRISVANKGQVPWLKGKKVAPFVAHSRWHIKRGIINPLCQLCRPDFFNLWEAV